MLQVIQYQKDGSMLVEELPLPVCIEGGILVRNLSSVISAGTEKTSVTNAQSGIIGRIKKQPKEVKMVMNFIKKEGVVSTAKRVLSALDSYKTLGYSSAGIVIESKCEEFNPGDFVACGGAGFAVHAEVITVPKNLAVKIPDGITMDEASFATVGAIALQGVRQSDVRLGENVAVIGLGLLGQITVQLLKASGCRVAGLDINEALFARAMDYGCDVVFTSSKDNIRSLLAFTRGLGFDSVIITASTGSNEPMELAINIARKKGNVVVVGSIGMNIPRSPFYEKELNITISCSYGPGRYDPRYEIDGNDFPAPFVRWTENRNMQAILDLIAAGKLDVESLITHNFNIEKAASAYDIISGKVNEEYLGIIINYPERENFTKKTILLNNSTQLSEVRIAFIGAGSFAQNYLLPQLKAAGVNMVGVTTYSSVNAISVGRKFGFKMAGTDSLELIRSGEINSVFCASLHDSHSEYVIEAIKNNKPVFVEKPLAVNIEQLEAIDKAVVEFNGRIMVGFNRRFSKPFEDIKHFFRSRTEPMAISYRVNAGMPPITYWAFKPEQGGGRIIGEACHFIDCMAYLTDAVPVKIFAECISSSNPNTFNKDNAVISIKFSDGSVGSLQYFANGDGELPKEYCEVHCEASSAIMNNFEIVEFYRGSRETKKYDGRKGHKEEILATVNAMKSGAPMPIDYDTIRQVTLATFAAIESMKSGYAVEI